MTNKQKLPTHVERAIDSLAKIHIEHEEAATRRMRAIALATTWLGRPGTVIALVVVLLAALVFAAIAGDGDVMNPALDWLELGATLAALIVALLILATQRHEDALAQRRSQLTLELAIIADQRNAKLVELIEALRRDAPGLGDRPDRETEDMARPADAAEVLEEIDRRTPDQ